MSSYAEQGPQERDHPHRVPAGQRGGKDLLWVVTLVGGILWVAVVVWFLAYSLERAEFVVAQGTIPEPTSAQVALAYAMAIIFALPGVGLIVYGLARRRWAGGQRHDEVRK